MNDDHDRVLAIFVRVRRVATIVLAVLIVAYLILLVASVLR